MYSKMGEVFKVGKEYEAANTGLDILLIMRRTDKTIWVKNTISGHEYRQRIKIDDSGNEYFVDSNIPKRFRDDFKYSAKWEI